MSNGDALKGYLQSKTVQAIIILVVTELLRQLGIELPGTDQIQVLAGGYGAVGVRDALNPNIRGVYRAPE